MKLNPFAIFLFCLVSVSAQAADLPMRSAPPVFVPSMVQPSTWTGFYIGANAGYAFDGDTSYSIVGGGAGNVAAIAAGTRPSYFRTRANGFTGGGQIGYNLQLGNSALAGSDVFGGLGGGFVAGIEADAAYMDLRGAGDFVGPLGLRDSNFQSRTDFLGTVRGRLGYAFGDLLVFGTGGFAYGGVRDTLNYSFAGVPNYFGRSDTIRTGYAYGGGVEYAIPTASFLNIFHSSAVTLKAEYLHYDLGTSNVTAFNLAGSPNTYVARVRTDGDLVRAGINYKFDLGAPSVPVVARY